MTSLELDLIASQIEDADATDLTKDDDEEESTDATIDEEEEEVRMDADSTDDTISDKISMDADNTEQTQDKFADDTDSTSDKFNGIGRTLSPKIPASEIIVRDIVVETAPLAALPADSDAAFGQWLASSGLPSLN